MASTSRLSSFDPAQFAIAIHTTSPELGLALSNFVDDRRCQTWELGRATSTHLHTYLEQFRQPHHWDHLAFVVVANGPGGFTGTRIGVVTARTLAQQLDVPLFALSSLAAIAWSTLRRSPTVSDVAVQMQAQRGQVYGAVYSLEPPLEAQTSPVLQTQLADAVFDAEQWQHTLNTWPRPYRLVQADGGIGASAADLLDLAYAQWQRGDRPAWSDALPFYGQSPV